MQRCTHSRFVRFEIASIHTPPRATTCVSPASNAGGIELECERQGQDVEVQRVEALFAMVEDARVFEKHRVLKARDVATASEILK